VENTTYGDDDFEVAISKKPTDHMEHPVNLEDT